MAAELKSALSDGCSAGEETRAQLESVGNGHVLRLGMENED